MLNLMFIGFLEIVLSVEMCVRDKCADDAQLIIQFCRNISVCIQVGVDRILFGHNRRVSGAARHF